jgi:hypothetical protein
MSEAEIFINGAKLTHAQSATLRVAISSMRDEIKAEGLGNDEHGKIMAAAYLARLDELTALLIP